VPDGFRRLDGSGGGRRREQREARASIPRERAPFQRRNRRGGSRGGGTFWGGEGRGVAGFHRRGCLLPRLRCEHAGLYTRNRPGVAIAAAQGPRCVALPCAASRGWSPLACSLAVTALSSLALIVFCCLSSLD
jgi:hypothetical protein